MARHENPPRTGPRTQSRTKSATLALEPQLLVNPRLTARARYKCGMPSLGLTQGHSAHPQNNLNSELNSQQLQRISPAPGLNHLLYIFVAGRSSFRCSLVRAPNLRAAPQRNPISGSRVGDPKPCKKTQQNQSEEGPPKGSGLAEPLLKTTSDKTDSLSFNQFSGLKKFKASDWLES